MVKIIKYLWIALLFITFNSFADGDPYANERNVIVKPDEITVWKEYNGIHVRELPRFQLPNGHFMLDKNNVNYWRDFNDWPCYYLNSWQVAPGKCINPDDLKKKHYDVVLDEEHNHNDVPEPEIMLMFGLGLVFYGLYKSYR